MKIRHTLLAAAVFTAVLAGCNKRDEAPATPAATPPAAPHQRLSLTASAILKSRHIFLQISGASKKAVYDRALAGGPVEELPIRLALLQDSVPVDIWIAES